MTASFAPAALPYLLTEVEVRRVRRVSPSFVRLELGSAELAELGPDGPLLDQRFKLLLPGPDGHLPRVDDLLGADGDWWGAWQRLPEDRRGVVRTYTARERLGTGADTRLEVDVVVHDDADAAASGPGATWALQARVGDRALVLAPRAGHAFGGIEWDPLDARRVLLAGDETALPAIRGILRDLPDDARGTAVVEVPTGADVPDDVVAPGGVDVHWLPRDGGPRGDALQQVVVRALAPADADVAVPSVDDADVDPDLWETPAYSSSGEEVVEHVPSGPHPGLYAWIAGESRVVTGLRRALVNEIGLERHQVAFMGYWRDGVAMRG